MAARKSHVRVVAPGEKPKKTAPKTVTQAASSGTHRELLVAMRDRIAKTVEDPSCPPRDLASLTLRLAKIAEEIKALDHREEQEGGESAPVEDGDFDAASV